jgi:hypothetical protein
MPIQDENNIRLCKKHFVEKRVVGKDKKYRCNICHNEYCKKIYFEKNKEKILRKQREKEKECPEEKKEIRRKKENDYKRKIYHENKELYSKRAREWYANNREKRQNKRFKNLYGITLEQYLSMCELQNNKCFICKKKETVCAANKNIKNLSVDHCHSTGKVRGLLCSKCNCVIGYADESIELLERAIIYLRGHQDDNEGAKFQTISS